MTHVTLWPGNTKHFRVWYLFHNIKISHSSFLGTRKPQKILAPNTRPSPTASQDDNWTPGSQPGAGPIPSATHHQWSLHHSPPRSISHLFTTSNLSSMQWQKGSTAAGPGARYVAEAQWQEQAAGHGAVRPSNRKGSVGAWDVGQWWSSGHGDVPSELSAWNAFWKYISMAEDDLVLLDLCSSSFESGHRELLYKGRAKGCWQDFWCLQWCQWETSLDCSMADLCFTSYWPKKTVTCSWPPQGKICWSCPVLRTWFSVLWVFQSDETGLHILFVYQAHYPRVAHQGADFG